MLNVSWLLAQDDGGAAGAAGAIGALVGMVVYFGLIALIIAGVWKTFAKAGKPGWAAIIPIYNIIIMLEIAGKPIWWIILFLIPCVNIIMAIILCIEFAKAYGKGAGFGLGLAFLGFIFFPILGFGDAKYVGVPQS
jgi:hypothetical protein